MVELVCSMLDKQRSVAPNLVDDFEPGDRVIYAPNHANGDISHPDCELGIVSSLGQSHVFVRFTKGDTAAGCPPSNLHWVKF